MAQSNTKIDPSQVKWDSIDRAAIKWDGAPVEDAPSPLGGDGSNFLAGMGRGFYNLGAGTKQRLDEAAAALERIVPGSDALNRLLGGRSAAQIRDEGKAEIEEQRRLDKPLMATKAGMFGDVAGTVAGGSVLAPLGVVQSGAALGYLTPTAGDESVLKNTALSAGMSLLGDKAVKGVARVIQPKTTPEAAELLKQGVQMTPGQIIGGVANKVEERATSLPLVGDAIANARRRSAESLNTVAINRALSPIGEKLPKGTPFGREAIQYADDALGDAYNKILPKLTTQADAVFVQDIQALRGAIQNGNMGTAEAQQFNKILQNQVLSKFQGQNAITGETLKAMESDLGRLSSNYLRDVSADKRQLGGAIAELQSSLRDLVQRSNPQYAKELKDINSGWANFKRVQKAASSVAAEDGIFSPAQLQNAVKAADRSKDKGSFAKGSALMQDLSDPARKRLGANVPDSGTAGRLMNAGAIASGIYNPGIPAALFGAAALYSKPGTWLAQQALTRRPDAAAPIARQVERLAPVGGLLGAASPQLLE
jgi:hypothetical protein